MIICIIGWQRAIYTTQGRPGQGDHVQSQEALPADLPAAIAADYLGPPCELQSFGRGLFTPVRAAAVHHQVNGGNAQGWRVGYFGGFGDIEKKREVGGEEGEIGY